MNEPTLEALAATAATGDLDAFEQLARQTHARLMAYLHLAGVPSRDLDDLGQEVLLATYRGLRGYDPARAFLPWFKTVTGHVVANHWRKLNRDAARLQRFAEYAALEFDRQEPGPGEAAGTAGLRRCLERLPPRHQEIVRLRYEQGLDCRGLAERLAMQAPAIRQALCRIRLALRQCLTENAAGT